MGGVARQVGNFVGDISGSNRAAEAAEGAARAQAGAAQANRDLIMGEAGRYETELRNLASASPEELRAFERSLSAGEKQLAYDERLLSSIDPGIMEASNRILSIIRGESRPDSSLVAMRQEQRRSLVDSLRHQYGPGAETSSIGLKALRDFDMQSSADLVGQSQQLRSNELQSLGSIFGMYSGARPDLLRTGTNLANLSSVFRNRQLGVVQNAANMRLSALSGTSADLVNTAGAEYVGEATRANAQMGLFRDAMQGAMMAAGASTGGGGGGMSAAQRNSMQNPKGFYNGKPVY